MINDVSETSLWVAYYRAMETERPDALFKDPFAAKLAGEKGKRIASEMSGIGKYTAWAVVSRTVMIDGFIRELIAEGVNTVVNLGAGLDTRPYRMELPPDLHWIEVDYPNIIAHKTEVLKNDEPVCRLTRVAMDLADDGNPDDWFGFFEAHGWVKKSILYSLDIARASGRAPPMPWWAKFLIRLAPKSVREESQKMNGFVVLRKK